MVVINASLIVDVQEESVVFLDAADDSFSKSNFKTIF
jgi:hypothetical protein